MESLVDARHESEERAVQHGGKENSGEGKDRSDRKIDPGYQDHEGHSQADETVKTTAKQEIGDVPYGKEVLREKSGNHYECR